MEMRSNKGASSHHGLSPHSTEVQRESGLGGQALPGARRQADPAPAAAAANHPRARLRPEDARQGERVPRRVRVPRLAQATACRLASPLPRFSPGRLPKRESATANKLPEKVCHPGVSRGAVASGYLCRAADPMNTEGRSFPVAGKCDEQKSCLHHRLDGHEFEQALGNSGDRGALCATVHRLAKGWTLRSDWIAAANTDIARCLRN